MIAIRIYGEAGSEGAGGEMVAYATSTYALPATPTVPRADLPD